MKFTRRQFVKSSALGVAGILAYKTTLRSAYAFNQSPGIPLFGTPLRGVYPLDPNGIPVAIPDNFSAPVTGVTHYTIDVNQYQDQIVPGLGPTTFRGYHPSKALGGSPLQRHLGGIIVGQKGVPIQITFRNNLPGGLHIIPNDPTILGANQGNNRLATHFHGGLVPWISDGGPFDWFDPCGNHGLSFLNNKVLNPLAPHGSAEYYYPLNQSARFGWYHDHAFGITRINAYAGIASGLLIRDNFEANLVNMGLPDFIEKGGNEIPLVIQDKIFVGQNIREQDRKWSSLVQKDATRPGSLWYAHTYEPNPGGRWDLGPEGLPLPQPSIVPEFFGDTMLVNGTTFPQATVEARRYRLRFLNACNARFLNLQLFVADGSPEGITLDAGGVPTNEPYINRSLGQIPAVLQIGTEGGFLGSPVKIPTNIPVSFNANTQLPSRHSLLIGPAERPDILVDFSGYAGKSIILYNDADAPFPSGDDRNDYFPGWNVGPGTDGVGNPVNGTTPRGKGPNTRVLMKFNVVEATSKDQYLAINDNTDLTAGIDPLVTPFGVHKLPPGVRVRTLTLNEDFDAYGRLIQMLGTDDLPTPSSPTFGRAYMDDTTEVVQKGAEEVWEIYNLTGDVHPMHFHLVNVQVINRQAFDAGSSNLIGPFTSRPVAAPPDEWGWKETVKMYPNTVTRIYMKFTLPKILTATGKHIPTPSSPRTGGSEYVWHCHILEHEEHDMMRPLVVL